MGNKIYIATCLVLYTCALPRAALCAGTEPDAVPTAQRLFAGMKKAAKATVNRMHGLGEVAPRAPYRGAIAIDAATGKVIFQDGAGIKSHPASCTKMMTLLLVLEDLRAGRYARSDTVAASAYAATFHGSSLGITAGEVITIENLLYALMIHSANDGAVVLAEHAGGHPEVATSATLPEKEVSKRRVQVFVDRMNRRARELGMAHTRYVSPNGLTPYGNQAYPGFDVTTAEDLAKLARHLVTMPEVFTYTSCAAHTIAVGPRTIPLAAHNYFLPGTSDPQGWASPVPECDGIKTGFTEAAGASIVLTAQHNGRRVIVVVLGCADRRTRETSAARILHDALAVVTDPAWAPL